MTKDEAVALKQSPYWESLCGEIDRLIEGDRLKLESADPKTINVIIIQERIKALRRLKGLPGDIVDRES